jgi:hypothetical protein
MATVPSASAAPDDAEVAAKFLSGQLLPAIGRTMGDEFQTLGNNLRNGLVAQVAQAMAKNDGELAALTRFMGEISQAVARLEKNQTQQLAAIADGMVAGAATGAVPHVAARARGVTAAAAGGAGAVTPALATAPPGSARACKSAGPYWKAKFAAFLLGDPAAPHPPSDPARAEALAGVINRTFAHNNLPDLATVTADVVMHAWSEITKKAAGGSDPAEKAKSAGEKMYKRLSDAQQKALGPIWRERKGAEEKAAAPAQLPPE